MNGVDYTVTGVMPASFDLNADTEEIWAPIAFTPAQRALHDEHYLTVYGRLKPGASIETRARRAGLRRGARAATTTREMRRISRTARVRSATSSSATIARA